MYVHVRVSHAEKCQFVLMLMNSGITTTCCYKRTLMEDGVGGGTTFLDDGGLGGQPSWAFAMYVFGRVKCRNEC